MEGFGRWHRLNRSFRASVGPMSVELKASTRNLTPIAVFCYDRPDHLRRCIEALQGNVLAAESDLFVFSDAPKEPARSPKVAQVRNYIRTIGGFKTVTVIEQPQNLGLATSIISGVTKLTQDFGKVIVVEDDLLVSPYFLQFMNDGLDFYAGHDRVAGIHGYMFPVSRALPETFFLRDPGCWGWATWKRAWDLFEIDGERLKQEIVTRGQKNEFDYDGQYDYFGMLEDQIAGRNSSWAVRWHASVFLSGRLVLHPGVSLVRNIGQDGSGTHDKATSQFDVQLSPAPVSVGSIPVEESAIARAAMIEYLRSMRGPVPSSFCWRIVSRLRRAISSPLFG
jgi:hypothetical protein